MVELIHVSTIRKTGKQILPCSSLVQGTPDVCVCSERYLGANVAMTVASEQEADMCSSGQLPAAERG
jgi:hypothetical protein